MSKFCVGLAAPDKAMCICGPHLYGKAMWLPLLGPTENLSRVPVASSERKECLQVKSSFHTGLVGIPLIGCYSSWAAAEKQRKKKRNEFVSEDRLSVTRLPGQLASTHLLSQFCCGPHNISMDDRLTWFCAAKTERAMKRCELGIIALMSRKTRRDHSACCPYSEEEEMWYFRKKISIFVGVIASCGSGTICLLDTRWKVPFLFGLWTPAILRPRNVQLPLKGIATFHFWFVISWNILYFLQRSPSDLCFIENCDFTDLYIPFFAVDWNTCEFCSWDIIRQRLLPYVFEIESAPSVLFVCPSVFSSLLLSAPLLL